MLIFIFAFLVLYTSLKWSATTSRFSPRNGGLLDGVNIGPPTRTRATPGNPVSVGNTIVG